MKHPDPRLRAYCDLVVAEPGVGDGRARSGRGLGGAVEDALAAVALVRELAPAEAVRRRAPAAAAPASRSRSRSGIPVDAARGHGDEVPVPGRAGRRSAAPCTVVHARSEDYARGEGRDRFPLALARALAPPPVAAELVLPLVGRRAAQRSCWTGAGVDADALGGTAAVVGGRRRDGP